jgi:hypothetical protein
VHIVVTFLKINGFKFHPNSKHCELITKYVTVVSYNIFYAYGIGETAGKIISKNIK